MRSQSHPAVFVIFVLIVAPVGAAVIVAVLLLFSMPPRIVFAPGWELLAILQRAGVRAPNAVGVAGTVGLWWLLLVAIGTAWERRRFSPHRDAHSD